MRPISSAPSRLTWLLVYTFVLFACQRAAFGTWVPSPTSSSLWLVAGFISLILSSFLVTPYFEKPANYIASGIAAFVSIWLTTSWESYNSTERMLCIGMFSLVTCVIVTAAIAIYFARSKNHVLSRIARSAKVLADSIGTDRFLFSCLILYAVVMYHRNAAVQTLWILTAWSIVVVIRPEAALSRIFNRLWSIWVRNDIGSKVGEIAGYDEPGIVLIREPKKKTKSGQVVVVNDRHSEPMIAQVLSTVGRDHGILLRAHIVPLLSSDTKKLTKIATRMEPGTASTLDPKTVAEFGCKNECDILGLVAPQSDIRDLRLELLPTAKVEEGKIVTARIEGETVAYQVTNGTINEETVYQKNARGYAIATARKIGAWDETEKRFVAAPWLPVPYAPVYGVDVVEPQSDIEAVGRLPGTNYHARIDSLHQLVTHNTAILGVLGVGKSFLAIELLERMFHEDVKVICLDLTNQYAEMLSDFYDGKSEAAAMEALQSVGRDGKKNVSKNVEEGGSTTAFRQAVEKDIEKFLEGSSFLKIYNPASFDVWRQDSRPFNNEASMASLTPAEITRVITEATLNILSTKGMTDKAQVCLVYEEAHSLVPEWSSAVAEGDRAATNGTARAILQGRKYGMGCLLISQRTANVTKTILNQCNTVFAFQTFDETGKTFLANYIGRDYAAVLSSLPPRHAVFFGKASNCESPMIIAINDRDAFVKSFRELHPIPMVLAPTSEAVEEQQIYSDDIPF